MYLCNSVKTLDWYNTFGRKFNGITYNEADATKVKLFRFPNVLDAEVSFSNFANIKYMPMMFQSLMIRVWIKHGH